MREKFHRFCSRHRWAPPVMTLLFIVTMRVIFPDAAGPLFWTLCGLMLLLSLLGGSSSTLLLQNVAVKVMNEQCDPYPLLEETDRQLLYVKSRSDRNLLSLNRCAALMEAGYFDGALTELERINIDDPTAPLQWRYVYYHNLTLTALSCGQEEKAQVYYHKAMQQFDAANDQLKEKMRDHRTSLTAAVHLSHSEYEQAASLLAPQNPDTLLARVHRAYSLGRIALAQNNPTIARVHLEYVVNNSGRTYLVPAARKLLEEMDSIHAE